MMAGEPDTQQPVDGGHPRRNLLLFLVLSGVVLGLDLSSKYLVFARPEAWANWPWIEPAFNRGVAWGFGGEHPTAVVVITLVVVPALFVAFWRNVRHHAGGLECTFWGLAAGGALGNAWDRVFFYFGLDRSIEGVRDFISVDLGFWPFAPWPTFNLADAALTSGLVAIAAIWLAAPSRTAPVAGDEDILSENG